MLFSLFLLELTLLTTEITPIISVAIIPNDITIETILLLRL
jgi:hypothetical protein